MATILQNSERISGQKVNYDKSSMIFGTRITGNMRRMLQHILKIELVRGGGKYLGLPEQLGKKKTKNQRETRHLVQPIPITCRIGDFD